MKLTLARSGWLALVAALATLAPVSHSFAADYTWSGAGNGNWFTSSFSSVLTTRFVPANGSSDTLGNTDNLFFGGGGVASVNNTASFNNLTFQSGNTASIGGGSNMILRGDITSNMASPASIAGAGGITLSPTGVKTVIDTGAGGINISRAITANFDVEKKGTGTLNITGDAGNFASVLKVTSGSVNVSASANTFFGSISSSSAAGVSVLSNVTGTTSFTAGNNAVASSGKIIGTVISTGGNLAFAGGTVSGTTLLKDTITNVGGGSTFGGALTIDGGTATITGATIQSDLNVLSGSVVAGTNITPMTISGNYTQSGGYVASLQQVNGTLTTTGGTVSLGGDLSSPPFVSGSTASLGGKTFFTVGDTGTATFQKGLTLTGGADTHLTFQNPAGVNQTIDLNNQPLNYGGQLSLDLTTGGTSANGSQWQFFDNFSSTSGSFSGVAINTLVGGSYAALNADPFFLATSATSKYDYRYGDGVWLSNWTNGQRFIFDQKTGILTVVPEPSTIVFAGIGAAMLGWQTWAGRRRKARMKLIDEHTRKLSEQRGLV